MSNVTLFNPTQAPSFAKKAELSAIAKALAGGGGGQTGKQISVKGGVFRLKSGGKEIASIEDRHLDVVIVNAAPKISRTFYAGPYDEANVSGPTCWSADGDKPDASIASPQASSCATCPNNVKGSGQGDSRACRFSQRLAVTLANDMGGDVLQLVLAATSIFGKEEGENRPLQAYARYLAAQSISPEMVVTRLKFDTKAAVPKLFFKATRWLDDTEYETATERGATPEALNAITMSVSTKVSKPSVPALTAKATEEESFDEPEKRAPAVKQTAVPKKASNLASAVAEWDTDDE